MLSGISSVLIC